MRFYCHTATLFFLLNATYDRILIQLGESPHVGHISRRLKRFYFSMLAVTAQRCSMIFVEKNRTGLMRDARWLSISSWT